MKRCQKCGESKPASDYRRDNGRPDGLYAWCRACCQAHDRARADQIRARKQAYYQHQRDERLAHHRDYNRRNRTKIANYNREHYAANRVKYQARAAVQTALAAGRLVIPAQCKRCRTTERPLIGHHWSYAREHWLDVEWLCRTCHARHHAQENAA